MKKFLALLLAGMMCLSLCLIAGAEEIPVITIAVQDTPNVEDFNTNWTTLQLEEKLGVDIQFEVYPATDYGTKINAMIMSGGNELPDALFVTPSDAQLLNWIGSGCIIPLTEYYADPEKSPHIHEQIELTGSDFTKMLVQFDGNIYSVPTLNQSYTNEYSGKAFFNTKWLNQLGKEAPTTPEELYDLLVLVKNTDLNGNGKADEIGMVGGMNGVYEGWFNYIMNAYSYCAGAIGGYQVQNGVVSPAFITDGWKEGLKFMAKLFAEDLIPKEILTQDANQYLAMLNSEECTTMSFFYTSPSRINAANAWRNEFEAYAPLINKDTGKPQTAYNPSTPNNGSYFITKNCKNPDAAFAIGDLMVSEYFSIVTRWGQEGVDWDYTENVEDADKYEAWVDGFDKLLLAYDDAKFWSSGEMQNRSYIQRGPYIRRYGVANGRLKLISESTEYDPQAEYQEHVNAADNLYQVESYRPDEVIPKLVYSEEEIEIVSEIATTLNEYRNEWTANALAGNLDIDADWDNFVNEVKNIGVDELTEVYQTVYDRMYK